jgi:hypothetical protein
MAGGGGGGRGLKGRAGLDNAQNGRLPEKKSLEKNGWCGAGVVVAPLALSSPASEQARRRAEQRARVDVVVAMLRERELRNSKREKGSERRCVVCSLRGRRGSGFEEDGPLVLLLLTTKKTIPGRRRGAAYQEEGGGAQDRWPG